jgi:hypothetical protein
MTQFRAAHAAPAGGPPPAHRARRFRRLPVLIVLAAGLGAGTACAGSGSGGNGVASIKTASEKSSGSDQAAKDDKGDKDGKTNPEDAMLAFARCMREHGIDMPDPDTSSGGPGVVTFHAGAATSGGADPGDADMHKLDEAQNACKDLMGDVGPMNMSPEQQQEMQDQALAFSRCMREHGVNMPDPSFDGEGHTMMKIDDSSGIDPSDPKFEAAQQACGSAFGPAGAKAGAGVSVAGGGAKGGPGGSKGGVMVFGGATAGGGK